MMELYQTLQGALREQIEKHGLKGQSVNITCKALSATEAIGTPEHDDYPIIKGKEVMVEAEFRGAKGQAFADEFEQAMYRLDDLVTLNLNVTRARASFIAGLNAVYSYLGLCDKTVHCKDQEPVDCARGLLDRIAPDTRVLLVGFQPRFVDTLSTNRRLRVVDRDPENIGKIINGVTIESADMTDDAIGWCDLIWRPGQLL